MTRTSLAGDLVRQLKLEFRFGLDGWTLASLLIGLVTILPLSVIFIHIFRSPGETWEHLASTVLGSYVLNTVGLLAGVGVLATVFGVGSAWVVAACQFPGRRIFEWALILPLAVPTYISAYAYSAVLDRFNPVLLFLRDHFGQDVRHRAESALTHGMLIFVFAAVLYPYIYLIARAAFMRQTRSTLEMSRILGVSSSATFLRVALPMARPAIIGGLSLALMEVLNDYGAVSFFGVPTLTTGIFRAWFSLGDLHSAIFLSALLLIIVFALVVFERALRGRARFVETGGRARPFQRYPLTPAMSALTLSCCFLLVLFGFLVPAGHVVIWALGNSRSLLDPGFVTLLAHSFLLAAGAAVLVVVSALIIVYAGRIHRTLSIQFLGKLVLLGYSIPGAVVAVGIMIPLGRLDHMIDGFMQNAFGRSTGLLLSGTLAAVMLAYLVRFLAVGSMPLQAGMTQVCGKLEEASRLLGRPPLATLFRINLPLLRPTLISAAILVFVDVLKELPLTLVLRPFNFETLATKTFGLVSEGRIPDAATPALIIIATGMVPVILLNRILREDGHDAA